MKTLEEEWRDYQEKVIPRDAGADQIAQLKAAFYAGCLVVMQNVEAAGDLSEAEAVLALQAMNQAARSGCGSALLEMKQLARQRSAGTN